MPDNGGFKNHGEMTESGCKAIDHIEYVSFVKGLGDLDKAAGICADASGYHAIMK